jgi:hypothetical protein
MISLHRISALAFLALLLFAGCSSNDPDPVDPGDTTPSNLTSYTARSLSSQGSTVYGHLYDADLDSTYRINFYSTKNDQLELIYFWDSNDSCVLASPDLGDLTSVMNFSGYITHHNITDANTTHLKRLSSVTASQFDALKDTTQLKAFYNQVSTSASKVTHVAVNDVIGFDTSEDRIGLLKVLSFSGSGGASSITFAVKMTK